MSGQYFVYIMTNTFNTALYTGVTNNLRKRVEQHRMGQGGYFSRKYRTTKLVYFELFKDVRLAISREKQIKAGSRESKNELIVSINPEWEDLVEWM